MTVHSYYPLTLIQDSEQNAMVVENAVKEKLASFGLLLDISIWLINESWQSASLFLVRAFSLTTAQYFWFLNFIHT